MAVETLTVVACSDCGLFWYADGETAKCTDASHTHQRFDVHRHRDVVVLPDGTEVVASSFDARDPYGLDPAPAFGLYLDARWQPPWPHAHIDWPDFGVPSDPDALATALRALLDGARAGARVEIGCAGGHGRTGTALACLATMTGTPDGVAWVREHYCAQAIETSEQEAFVERFRAV